MFKRFFGEQQAPLEAQEAATNEQLHPEQFQTLTQTVASFVQQKYEKLAASRNESAAQVIADTVVTINKYKNKINETKGNTEQLKAIVAELTEEMSQLEDETDSNPNQDYIKQRMRYLETIRAAITTSLSQ